jgi:hypothetical protein
LVCYVENCRSVSQTYQPRAQHRLTFAQFIGRTTSTHPALHRFDESAVDFLLKLATGLKSPWDCGGQEEEHSELLVFSPISIPRGSTIIHQSAVISLSSSSNHTPPFLGRYSRFQASQGSYQESPSAACWASRHSFPRTSPLPVPHPELRRRLLYQTYPPSLTTGVCSPSTRL